MKIILFAPLLLVCLRVNTATAQILEDIEGLEVITVSAAAFDSMMGWSGLTLPVNFVDEKLDYGKTWTITGRVADFTESEGCGCIICTAGTMKIAIKYPIDPYKEQFVYVVQRGLRKASIPENKDVSIQVRYLKKSDSSFTIFNKFETDVPFLIHDL